MAFLRLQLVAVTDRAVHCFASHRVSALSWLALEFLHSPYLPEPLYAQPLRPYSSVHPAIPFHLASLLSPVCDADLSSTSLSSASLPVATAQHPQLDIQGPKPVPLPPPFPCHPQLATLAHGLECLSHTWVHFLNLVSAIVSSLILRHSNLPFALRNLLGTHLPSELSHIILNSPLLSTLGCLLPGVLGSLESEDVPFPSPIHIRCLIDAF